MVVLNLFIFSNTFFNDKTKQCIHFIFLYPNRLVGTPKKGFNVKHFVFCRIQKTMPYRHQLLISKVFTSSVNKHFVEICEIVINGSVLYVLKNIKIQTSGILDGEILIALIQRLLVYKRYCYTIHNI